MIMKKLLKYLSGNRRSFALALFCGIIYSAICIITPNVSGELINEFIEGAPQRARVLALYLVLSAMQIIFFLLDQKASKHFDISQKETMRKNAFAAFSLRDDVTKEKAADFSSFVNNDIPCASSQYFLGYIEIAKCIALIAFTSVSLLYIHWALALIVISLSALIVLVPNFAGQKSGDSRKAYSEALGAYNARLQSYLGGLRVFAAYLYHDRGNKIIEENNRAVSFAERTLVRHQRMVEGATACLQTLKTILILVAGVFMISSGEINFGSLIVVLELDAIIGAPIEFLAYIIHGKNEAAPLVEKYAEIIEAPNDIEKGRPLDPNWSFIKLDGLSYKLGDVMILDKVTASFLPGRKYLITGPSGSGKSTLLRLLGKGGDDSYEGAVSVGEQELREIAKSSYNQKVCQVFQEPYLFNASIEENILLGRDVPAERYSYVIQKLGLCYLFERYEKRALSEEVIETLSGGEKQRICLARAMVGCPDVYLLDEVTSALDSGTARSIERAVLDESAAVLHVCHKPTPELIKSYDMHFELSGGKFSVVGGAAG